MPLWRVSPVFSAIFPTRSYFTANAPSRLLGSFCCPEALRPPSSRCPSVSPRLHSRLDRVLQRRNPSGYQFPHTLPTNSPESKPTL